MKNIMMINKNNDIIIRYKDLLKGSNNEYVATDDVNTISLAYKYGIEIEEFFYCSEIDYHEDTSKLIQDLTSYSKNVSVISKKTYESLANKDNSVGLFGIIVINNNGFDKIKDKDFLVVCDGLEIPGNLGTIYRTMDSANVQGCIITNLVTHPFTNKNTISSRGCNLLVPTWIDSFENVSSFLINNGYDVYLGEPIEGKCYKDYDYKGKIAIVVGNERFGIDDRWYRIDSDKIRKVFIPMYGSNNSLNVAVAASILIYEAKLSR